MQAGNGEKEAPLSGLDVFIKLSDPNSEYSANAAKALTSLGKLASASINSAPLTNALATAVSSFSKIRHEIDWPAIMESLAAAQERIAAVVKSVQTPTISEARKLELLDAYTTWGEYGWTMNPEDSVFAFWGAKPQSKSEADKRARKKCRNMEPVFDAIRACKRAKLDDLEEAISDFSDKRYRSCALVLFGLIDAKLIRFQRIAETKGGQRAVGKGAVAKAKNRVDTDASTRLLFLSPYYQNLFVCLERVFQRGNDFKVQPKIINRNFLDHGMLTRKVTRTDCVQLFLLYYNVLKMLDLIYGR